MLETATFLLILALIWVNHRREVWKFRAQIRKAENEALKTNIQTEQNTNAALTKLLPKGSVVYRQNDWPEALEDD